MIKKIPFVDLSRQYNEMRNEIDSAISNVLKSGLYVFGPEVALFEKALADICDTPYCLTVANGTDALVIAMKALGIGIGDEVIIPTNSFIASAGSVVQTGAKPIFCDVLYDFNIDCSDARKRITANTKAIMPVHLTGRPADMSAVKTLSKEFGLFIIEDAAQAIGASLNGQKVGSMGDIACFSLHPLKNLFVPGDGGFITMKCPFLFDKIKKIRNHGLIDRDTCAFWGMNSRLDNIHCAVGLIKVKEFDRITSRFKEIASMYRKSIAEFVSVPDEPDGMSSVYHNFVVKCEARDELARFLAIKGVETKTHYPILLHRQPASAGLTKADDIFPKAEWLNARQLSLPIFPELTDKEVMYIIEQITSFYTKS